MRRSLDLKVEVVVSNIKYDAVTKDTSKLVPFPGR
jgi:hypothetical protein